MSSNISKTIDTSAVVSRLFFVPAFFFFKMCNCNYKKLVFVQVMKGKVAVKPNLYGDINHMQRNRSVIAYFVFSHDFIGSTLQIWSFSCSSENFMENVVLFSIFISPVETNPCFGRSVFS